MTHPSLYLRLRKDAPFVIRRFFFDLYERDRWEAALSRAWFRCWKRRNPFHYKEIPPGEPS